MSGICGAVALDGRRPHQREVQPMLDAMRVRGPDGCRTWTGPHAALGHALLATTPEAVTEAVPLELGGCTITGDIRLDNRDELAASLGLERGGEGVGDCAMVVRAYLEWGDDCVTRLLGDFAFAIWDDRQGRLFAARDPLGLRQLCYAHRSGRAFVFATDPQAVARHSDVSGGINANRIAHFLDEFETADLEATFFRGVSRLLAAHRLVLTRDRLVIERYWTPQIPPQLRLKTDQDYAEALRETLGRAIVPRLRSATRVGATLSGGMDSSSVCALAAQILGAEGRGPLDTYSVVGPDPATCVETRAIHDAWGIADIRPHALTIGEDGPLIPALARMARELDDPFDASMNLPRAVFAAARSDGINVMLVGVGGDITLSLPTHLARLLRRGEILSAVREAAGERAYWGPSWPAWRPLLRGLVQGFSPPLWDLRLAAREQADRRRREKFGVLNSSSRDGSDLEHARANGIERDRRLFRADPAELARHITGPNMAVGLERYDRVAAACGVEIRDPFFDRRFIDFCLSLPFEQLQRDGYPKPILRRAMENLVPDPVRWRRGKEHLGHQFTQWLAPMAWPDPNFDRLAPWVRPDTLRSMTQPSNDVKGRNLRVDWLALTDWLARFGESKPG